MKQINCNAEVSIAVSSGWVTANGTGKNLGWILEPKNQDLSIKLRKAFATWYDSANDENNKNLCILAI